MADNGKLYHGFDLAFVEEMKKLFLPVISVCQILLKHVFLTATEYKENYDEKYTDSLLEKMAAAGEKLLF